MQPNAFTFLYFFVIMLGGMICAVNGFKSFGLLGGTIGAFVGATIGHTLGGMTSSAMNRLTERQFRRESTINLRARLDDRCTAASYTSFMIISILLERGDSVDSFRNYVFRQLNSGDVRERRAGLVNLGLCNPVLADELKGFNEFGPTEIDLARLKRIETEWPKPT